MPGVSISNDMALARPDIKKEKKKKRKKDIRIWLDLKTN